MAAAFERAGRNLFSRLLGILAPVHKVNPTEGRRLLEENPSGKILFIRPHQGLGDLLLATPVFRELQKAYPSLQIHFLADDYNVIAIKDNPRLGRVWVWDKKRMKNPLNAMAFIRALRREKYLIALPLSSHVPSFTSYLLARLCGARLVWGFDTTPFYGEAPWSKDLAHVVMPNRPKTDPEWVKFRELTRPLMARDEYADFTPEFEAGAENEAWARDAWQKISLPAGKKKIGLFFGGNPDRPERLWPAQYWGDLAARIENTPDMALVAIVPPSDFLSGSRALEQGVYPQVSARLKSQPPVFSHRDLAKVAAFIKGLDLFVCVDGGIFHVAVAYGVRTLGLFFMTDPACWKPPVPWAEVLRPADDKPLSLPPEVVYHKLSEMVLKFKSEPVVP